MLLTVVVFVAGAGVTVTLMVLPFNELVLKIVVVDAGSVVSTVVVESAESVIVIVD